MIRDTYDAATRAENLEARVKLCELLVKMGSARHPVKPSEPTGRDPMVSSTLNGINGKRP